MNSQEQMNLIRQLLTLVGGLAVMYGLMTAEQESALIAAAMTGIPTLVTIGSVLWSVYEHWNQIKVPEETILVKPDGKTTTAKSALEAGALGIALLAFVVGMPIGARAASPPLVTKAPINAGALFSGYPYQGSGFYWGLSAAATETTPTINGTAATGLQAFGGSLGGAVGYQWGVGNVAYAVENDAWWNNIGGSTTCNGASCSLTSQWSFEQRVKAMTPMATLLSLFPVLSNLPQLPGLPVLPANVTTIASNPYFMVGLHEDDISAAYGVSTGRDWEIAPGIGVGNLTQLSNKTALDIWGEWIPPGAGFSVGQNAHANQGSQWRFGMAVLW